MSQAHDPEDLLRAGYEAIREGDTEHAAQLGEALKLLQIPEGFDLIALSLVMDDNEDEALDVLREGIQLHPTYSNLWRRLADLQSDLELFEDAKESLLRAMACEDAELDALRVELAEVLEENDEFEEALAQLDALETNDPELLMESHELRLGILSAMGDHDLAQSTAEELLDHSTLFEDEDGNHLKSVCYCAIALAFWFRDADREQALEHAWRSLHADHTEPTALWLVRTIEGKRSPDAKLFKITMEGEWPQTLSSGVEKLGFSVEYAVVADSQDSAIAFAERCEPEDVRPSLWASKVEVITNRPEKELGVYDVSEYNFFPLRESRA